MQHSKATVQLSHSFRPKCVSFLMSPTITRGPNSFPMISETGTGTGWWWWWISWVVKCAGFYYYWWYGHPHHPQDCHLTDCSPYPGICIGGARHGGDGTLSGPFIVAFIGGIVTNVRFHTDAFGAILIVELVCYPSFSSLNFNNWLTVTRRKEACVFSLFSVP